MTVAATLVACTRVEEPPFDPITLMAEREPVSIVYGANLAATLTGFG